MTGSTYLTRIQLVANQMAPFLQPQHGRAKLGLYKGHKQFIISQSFFIIQHVTFYIEIYKIFKGTPMHFTWIYT